MEKRLMLFLSGLFLCVGMAIAQTQVKGTIISADDGEPLPGANIKVQGEKLGTTTNLDGEFTITVPNADARLEISHMGMISRTVKARNGMRIALDTDNRVLDELIVTAFGQQKKSSFTGSATVVGAEELQKSQVSSVTNALAGKVTGVQLTSSNGAPGSTSGILVRGFSSLNAGNGPLIVLDGSPYSGDIGNINPSDVESMTVLKDAASNALYGARGSNGVIMITTKKGKKGKDAEISFDAKFGWNSRALQKYDVITDPRQYMELHYDAVHNYYINNGYSENDAWLLANQNLFSSAGDGGVGYNIWNIPEGQTLIGRNGKFNPAVTMGRVVNYKGEDFYLTADDWDEEGTRIGHRQEYNLNVSGASDKGTYFISVGYLDNKGITENSDMKRLTARLNADYQAKDWLRVGGNVNYARFDYNTLNDNGNSTSSGNIWAFTTQTAPIYPIWIRNGDGSIKVDDNGIKVMDYGNDKNAGMSRPWISDANPIQDVRLNTNNSEGNAFQGRGFAEITFIQGLTLNVNGSFNLDETRYNWVGNGYYGQFDTTGGTVQVDHSRSYTWNFQQLLNYNFTIAKKNNFTAMLGHEYYDSRSYSVGATKHNMFSNKNKELDGAVVDNSASYSNQGRYNNEGYFGRILYDYDTKYFLQGSYRRDASSRFHRDYRWGNFWSVGAAWLMNKENFFKKLGAKWVDELKLKVSYGSQGNDNISNYLYTDRYAITNSAGNVGVRFTGKGTEDITWETNGNLNAGIEFQLFNHKLQGGIDYFYRKTTDMLYAFSVAPSNGYSSYWDNVGDLHNTGVELDLNYNPFHTKDIDWSINLNATYLRNRIDYIHEDNKAATVFTANGREVEGFTSGSFFFAEGESMYTWRLKEFAGVNEQGQNTWYKNTYEGAYDANDPERWIDNWYAPDGTVFTDDTKANYTGDAKDLKRHWTGRKATTNWSDADYYLSEETTLAPVFGGFGTTLKLYGFDFSINCSYQIGGKQYDSGYAQFMSSPTTSAGYNFHKDLLNAWNANNASTDIPQMVWGDTYSTATSTRFLTNASYLNIENINVGYTFPSNWTRKALINSLRIYASAENVYYWSKRKGFDPRQSYSSMTNPTYYSPMRTFSLGLKLTF